MHEHDEVLNIKIQGLNLHSASDTERTNPKKVKSITEKPGIEIVRAERNREETEGKKKIKEKKRAWQEAQYYHVWGMIEDPLSHPFCLQRPSNNNTINIMINHVNSSDISDVTEEVCCVLVCQKISPPQHCTYHSEVNTV